ncbi:MAG: DUF721 domain-containing protein [Deltaproteobacteria bacterium]
MIDRVSELLGRALADLGLGRMTDIRRLMDSWPEIVGERIAAQATPLALKGPELLIAVPDSVWRQELSLMQREIVAMVNEALGNQAVRKLRLVGYGTIEAETSPFARSTRRLRPPREVPAEFEEEEGEAPEAPALPGAIAEAFDALARARRRRLERDRN